MQSVTVAWSAAGGTANALLTHEHPTSVVVHYRIQVSFAIPGWDLLEFDAACPVKAGGDRIVIDPGSWIHYLRLQWQIADKSVKPTDVVDGIDPMAIADAQLVVNLTWQTAGLSRSPMSRPIKSSQKMPLNQVWELPYLGVSPQDQVTFTISAFGVIRRQMVRIPARSMVLTPLELAALPRLLLVSHDFTSHDRIQLIHSTN